MTCKLAFVMHGVLGAAAGQACALGAYIEVLLTVALISPASVPPGSNLVAMPHIWCVGSAMLLGGLVGAIVALRRVR